MTETTQEKARLRHGLTMAVTAFALAFPALAATIRHAASTIQFALALAFLIGLATLPWRQLHIRREQGAPVAWIFMLWPVLASGQMLAGGYFDGSAMERALRFALSALALYMMVNFRSSALRHIGIAFAVGAAGCAGLAVASCWHGIAGQLLQCRASNGFTNPVPFGGMALTLGTCALVSLRFEFPNLSRLGRIIRAVGTAGGLMACGLSQTRGAWIAMPALLLIALAPWHATWSVHGPALARYLRIPLALLLACVIAFFGNTITLRFDAAMSDVTAYQHGTSQTSIGARLEMWRTAGHIWRQAPWFGVGAGRWPQALAQEQANGQADSYIKGFSHPHNDYFQMLAEKGIVGLALLLASYAAPAAIAWRQLRRRNGEIAMHAHMCILICLAAAIFSLTESMLQIKFQVAFFSGLMVLSLAGAVAKEASADHAREP
ncbi:LPS ligase-like protein [Bordetella ansorpii]|uniref:LPS ligase-like protein n=1 Tax=Bordetella ansorpii TaxID=288768 RepID=A0A157SNL0_9BORD|nr:O-antigen ligase family protein [Bordetella ansorpii]SAI72037.1 LPS ligase-like protein [Bordetella ansorpii]